MAALARAVIAAEVGEARRPAHDQEDAGGEAVPEGRLVKP